MCYFLIHRILFSYFAYLNKVEFKIICFIYFIVVVFISEKGPQCISSKQPGIEQCIRNGMNETKTRDLYEEIIHKANSTSLQQIGDYQEKPFNFTFELEQCR